MKILYQQQQLRERIAELGEQISRDYEGKRILAIGLL
jgi:hypoxanthine phosphoribosyltransferase